MNYFTVIYCALRVRVRILIQVRVRVRILVMRGVEAGRRFWASRGSDMDVATEQYEHMVLGAGLGLRLGLGMGLRLGLLVCVLSHTGVMYVRRRCGEEVEELQLAVDGREAVQHVDSNAGWTFGRRDSGVNVDLK